jgi:predicted N-acetyltransferase YhbS
MMSFPFVVRAETSTDAPEIESLLDVAFGPGRFAKTAYRLREGVPHDPRLSFVAIAGDRLVGSVRLTAIRIGDAPALLLGPLAVAPHFTSRGAGRELVRTSLDAARVDGHQLVLLVGDRPYYGPLGFEPVPPGQITMPGPVDPARLLACPLVPGALTETRGAACRIAPAVV